MLCKYNGNGPWAVQTGLMDSGVIVFAPGANTIPDDHYALVKEHPEVKKRIADKRLEIIVESVADAKPADKDAPAGSEIGALNTQEAKKLIAETHNTVELNKWKESETRAGVLQAIEKQLGIIEKDREEAAKAAAAKEASLE